MRKMKIMLLMAMLLTGICACGDLDPIDEKIYEASNCIGDEDYERAKRICDNLYRNDYSSMALEQKCDLAVIYCIIYDELENDADLNKFMKVFKDTMNSNPQAARKYYKSVYGEDVYDMLQEFKSLGEMDEEWEAMERLWDVIW